MKMRVFLLLGLAGLVLSLANTSGAECEACCRRPASRLGMITGPAQTRVAGTPLSSERKAPAQRILAVLAHGSEVASRGAERPGQPRTPLAGS